MKNYFLQLVFLVVVGWGGSFSTVLADNTTIVISLKKEITLSSKGGRSSGIAPYAIIQNEYISIYVPQYHGESMVFISNESNEIVFMESCLFNDNGVTIKMDSLFEDNRYVLKLELNDSIYYGEFEI